MGICTFLLYLIGHRKAILDLAADRRTLWVGFVFVLSAGFAREYDGEDLLQNPGYLAIPFAASLVAAFILFLFCFGRWFIVKPEADPVRIGFVSGYASFLGLFWMTAPLAWLYAIPYERFLDPVDAMKANLATLGLVAAWRVLLMMRVVTVLTGRRFFSWHAFFRIMFFADLAVLIAIYSLPMPLLTLMGGIRWSPSERIVREAALALTAIGAYSILVWLIGALAVRTPPREQWAWRSASERAPTSSWARLHGLALFSVLAWVAVLPITQAEQQRRTHVERLFQNGSVAEALAFLSEHWPGGLPPGWDPPPHDHSTHAYYDRMVTVLEAIGREPPSSEVRALYVEKFREIFTHEPDYSHFWDELKKPELQTPLLRVLGKLPEGPELARHICLNAPPKFGYDILAPLAKEGATQDE